MTLGRSKRAKARKVEIQFHSDGYGQADAHPAINVKVYSRWPEVAGATDAQREIAYDATVEQWWQRAQEIAHEHGYSGVFSEGRSSGWLLPFYQTTKDGRNKFLNWPGQGGDLGYPRYPDVSDPAERKRFVRFREAIQEHLTDAAYQYEWTLKELVGSEVEAS